MALNNQNIAPSLPFPSLESAVPYGLVADYAHCHAILQAASKNYSAATRLLPRDKAHHVAALYAVMRVGDDLVDVDHAGYASPRAAIEHWHESYWRAFQFGDSPDPVLRAYIHTAQQCDIPAELLQPYFRAMIDDLTVTRFATFDDLMHYMDGSAVPVGRVMTHILGTTTGQPSNAYPAADALAVAMQLSNFWRDIGEDWARGRIYIPQEDLARFNYTEHDIALGNIDLRLVELLEYEFARTEQYYQVAQRGVQQLVSGRLGVMAALKFYRAILSGIRANCYDVFTQRAGASKLQKMGLVVQAWWQAR